MSQMPISSTTRKNEHLVVVQSENSKRENEARDAALVQQIPSKLLCNKMFLKKQAKGDDVSVSSVAGATVLLSGD